MEIGTVKAILAWVCLIIAVGCLGSVWKAVDHHLEEVGDNAPRKVDLIQFFSPGLMAAVAFGALAIILW